MYYFLAPTTRNVACMLAKNNVNKKLTNKNFTDRAPKNIVEHEEKKREQYQFTLKKIEDNLKSLKN